MTALSSLDTVLTNSNLYKEFIAEREEILKNKWYMSEREGKDVGFERALLDWTMHFRTGWKKARPKN